MTTLHLVCGLPGAGKSVLARRLEAETGAVRFTPDEWLLAMGFHLYDEPARARVEALQWQVAQDLLRRGQSVILENGFWTRVEREEYRATAKGLGADTRLHFVDAPIAELKRRVGERNLAAPEGARIDPADLDGWHALFERPDDDELTAPPLVDGGLAPR